MKAVEDKDHYTVQGERIRKLINERELGLVVEFDKSRAPNWIKFRIIDPINNVILGESAPEPVGAIADWSDEYLWRYIQARTADRL